MNSLNLETALRQAADFHKAGKLEDAERIYSAVLQAEPGHPDANHNLGVLALQRNQHALALPRLKAALEAKPDQGQYWLSYIDALIRVGQFDAARKVLEQGRQRGLQGEAANALVSRLAQVKPDAAEVEELVGLFNAGHCDEAVRRARVMAVRFAEHGLIWKVLGLLLMHQERTLEALEPLQRAAQLLRDDPDIHASLGHLLTGLGRLSAAEACYLRVLALKPDHAVAQSNLGNLYKERGLLDKAEACYRRALSFAPDYAEMHTNLGSTLRDQGRLPEAEACYRRALEIKTDFAAAHNNLGNVLKDQGRLPEAETSYRRALGIRPDFAAAHNNLGDVFKDLGNVAGAEACYRRALEIEPDFDKARSNLLFLLSAADYPPSACVEEARTYGRTVAMRVDSRFSSWTCSPSPQRLRIGMVSGDLRNHPVGYFLENLLSQLDSACIELIAYSTDPKSDELTARIKPYFSKWTPLFGMSDAAAARVIHADGIHVLLDLSGHTAHNRLPLFAWKPAPVQASWLGYFATTGVAEMDYLLADEVGVPESHRADFTERVWYLPDTRLCFTPPGTDLPVSSLPALKNGCVTFGCFQNLSKARDDVLAAWGRILASVPGARLRWQCKQLGNPVVADQLVQRLWQNGIDASRVAVHGATSRAAYLAAHAEVDMILDTFPYPGGTTTCEALWMGVPTLTLAGSTLLSRQGASLLKAANLPEWVAASAVDYVEKAIAMAGDVPRLAALRAGLRSRVHASPVFGAARFTRNFEAALRGMWQERMQSFQLRQ